MSPAFFIIGGVIFSVYIYFTLWNIYYSSKKQREENYPNYYDRHGSAPDKMDMDGMGNFSRFPKTNKKNETYYVLNKKSSKKKTTQTTNK